MKIYPFSPNAAFTFRANYAQAVMSYPKQQGYIPEYAGPPPVDLSEPECLDHALRQNNQEKIYFFIENPTFDGEINAPGYAG